MTTSHWAIGGSVEHDVAQARRDTYAHLQGAEGVCEVGDLKVRQTPTAGGNVRVVIGSAYMTSRYAGAVRESYMGSVIEQEVIPIPPNNTNAVRRDLIAMRVEDPFVQGSPWNDPGAGLDPDAADEARKTFQYIKVIRIHGVAAGVTKLQQVPGYENDTGVALGRVELPANQSQVLDSHIVDLRRVHTPRRSEVMYARPRVASDTDIYLTATDVAGGEYFPGGGGSPNEFQVEIPEWATRIIIDATWMSVFYQASKNPMGYCWIEFGDEYRARGQANSWPNKQQWEYATQKFSWNPPLTADERTGPWDVADELPIPAKLRGKLVTFVFKGSRTDTVTGNTQAVRMSGSGGLKCKLTFAERAIGADLL